MKKIHIAETDDWAVLYIDGKAAAQDHSLKWWDVLNALGLKYTQSDHSEDALEKMKWNFPVNQSDLIEGQYIIPTDRYTAICTKTTLRSVGTNTSGRKFLYRDILYG